MPIPQPAVAEEKPAESSAGKITTVAMTEPCKTALRALKSNWNLPSTGAVIERLARERVKVLEIVVSDGEYAALFAKTDEKARTIGEVARRALIEAGAFEMPAEVVE